MEKIHKQKEFKSLNNALLQDEVIHDYVVANIKNARFLVVATDKRVIFVQKKLMGESIEAINLDDIALSPFNSGFLGTSFGINHHVLKIQDKKKAQSFYNLLSPHSGQSNVVTTQHKKNNGAVGFIFFIILLSFVVASLNFGDNEIDPPQTTNISTKSTRPTTIFIEESQFKGTWPFTVDAVAVWCRANNALFVVSYGKDGGTYALNSNAKSNPEFFSGAQTDISPIWKSDGKVKVSLSDMIKFGLDNTCP